MTLKTVQQTTSNYHQAFPLIIYERKLSGFLPQLYRSFEDGKFDNSTGKITGELNGKVLIHQDTRLKPFFREIKKSLLEYLDHFKIDSKTFQINFTKTWHRSVSGKEGSIVINQAKRYKGFNASEEFKPVSCAENSLLYKILLHEKPVIHRLGE